MNSIGWPLNRSGAAAAVAGVDRRPPRLHRPLALLLVGAVAALVVLADRFVQTWTDGHLFLAWLALWAVVFAATALLDHRGRQRRADRSIATSPTERPDPPSAPDESTAALRRLTDLEHSRHGGFLPYL